MRRLNPGTRDPVTGFNEKNNRMLAVRNALNYFLPIPNMYVHLSYNDVEVELLKNS